MPAVATDLPAHAGTGPGATAVALRAVLPRLHALTSAERGLLGEWLDRVVADR